MTAITQALTAPCRQPVRESIPNNPTPWMKKAVQHIKSTQNYRGFSLIELVVVIVILGLLAAVALPRFTDMSDDAHTAQTRATSGAFRSGVTLAHAQWLADGGIGATVQMEGSVVSVTPTGWPGPAGAVTPAACIAVWNGILSAGSPPVSPPPFTPGNPGWAIFPAGVCVYLYQPDTAPFRLIVYIPTTGQTLSAP